MILDDIRRSQDYVGLHPGFAAGFSLLLRDDLDTLPVGRHRIEGERLVLIIGQDAAVGRDAARLEAHRRYIDIQYCIDGEEEIGWQAVSPTLAVDAPYDEVRDIVFFADRPLCWLALPTGTFAVFFPHDAHAPLAGRGQLHKAVVKVAVDW